MTGVLATNSFSAINLVEEPRCDAYFAMKHRLIHYCSLQDKNYRRDFNPEVASAIDTFALLKKKDRVALHQTYTIGYRKPATVIQTSLRNDWRSTLLNSVKRATEFFSIADLSDFGTLKSAYRREAKIHNADVGGSHEAMVALNSSYNLFVESVSAGAESQSASNGEAWPFEVRKESIEIPSTPLDQATWCTWLGPLAWEIRLVRISRDSDADACLAILRTSIAVDEYELTDAIRLFNENFLQKLHTGRRDGGWKIGLLQVALLLCKRLRAIRWEEEASKVAALVRNSNLVTTFPWAEKQLDSVMKTDFPPKVNPLHPRQRANFENISNQTWTGAAANLFTRKVRRDSQFREAISALGGFLRLSLDPSISKTQSINSTLIPQPILGTPLTDEQIKEYISTFYDNPLPDLVKKYLEIRSDIWFNSLFQNGIPLVRLLKEIKTVAVFFPIAMRRTPQHQLIDSLIPRSTFTDFAEMLLRLPPKDAQFRLDLLAAIDARHGVPMRSWLLENSYIYEDQIFFSDVRDTFCNENPKVLSPRGHLTLTPVIVRSWRKEWFKAACAPIGKLEHALETGWMVPSEEAIETAWKRWGDYSETTRLASDLRETAYGPSNLDLKTEERFIQAADNAIEVSLTRLNQTEFVEELHLGWWSANLVRALSQVGQRTAARRVAERFLNLPVRAHAWATSDEMDLLRRFVRSPSSLVQNDEPML